MKYQISLLFALILTFQLSAQLQPGTYAPDFTLTDIYGDPHTLSSYTSSGKTVVIVTFATWSPPDWDYYTSGSLQETWEAHGPDGDDTMVVLFIEGDPNSPESSIFGMGDFNDQGDFTEGVTYPILDDPNGIMINEYMIYYYPTCFVICPDGFIVSSNLISPTLSDIEAASISCNTASYSNDPALYNTNILNGEFCTGGTVDLSVQLVNMGFNDLTSCEITFSGALEDYVYNWTGNLSTYQSETIVVNGLEVLNGGGVFIDITSFDDNVSNNSSGEEIPENIEGTSHFHLQLMTDEWPEEISWALFKEGEIVYQGGPYAEQNTVYEQDFYVDELGCYKFVVYDSFGDGIHGEQWGSENGFLKLTLIDEEGNIAAEALDYDGSFDYLELPAFMSITEFVPVTISGYVFEDLDEDGYHDDTENGIGNIEVHLDNMVTYTNDNGAYSFVEPVNPESLSIVYDNTSWPSNTTPTSLTIDPVFDATYDFGLSSNDPNFDVSFTYTEPWMYFCQMESGIYLTVSNNGNQILDEVVVTMTVDPLLTIMSTTPESVINGNTIVWTFNDVTIGDLDYLAVNVMVPSFEFMGSDIVNTVLLQAYQDEVLVDEDTQTYPDVLECSYDPNDKQVSPAGETEAHYIMNGTDLEYFIRFQNTGTAPAFNINVNDMLDSDLDYSTFQLMATSHDCQPSINTQTGEVNFYFPDIMLPDSVSDEAGSHGFIRYRISPYPVLEEGTLIENTAYIYFDFNPAVVTNTTWNTVSDLYFSVEEFEVENVRVYPNPSNEMFTLYNTGLEKYTALSIFDMRGNMIRSERINLSAGQQISLATLELADGMYILDLSGDASSAKTILTVQH
jgi:uncharacterized repeat protein (TIGR01451 family)